MKVNLLEPKKIITTKIITGYEINSVMLVPNTSATISIFVYCDDNTLQEKIFTLIGKDYNDYVDDNYLFNYIDKNIEQIFTNN